MDRIIMVAAILLVVVIGLLLVHVTGLPLQPQEQHKTTAYGSQPTASTTTSPQPGGYNSTAAYVPPVYGNWSLVGYSSVKTALSLAAQLYNGDNLVISPFSIVSAMAIVYDCSYGETRQELARLLGFPLDRAAARDGYGSDLRKILGVTGSDYRVTLANSIWIDEALDPDPACVEAASYYTAEIIEASFARNPEAARKEINEWVSRKTNGLIGEAIPRGGIDRLTRAVIVNALYFKSFWDEPFRPVERMMFHTLDGTVEVKGFGDTRRMKYYEDQAMKAVLIPYKAPGYSMLVLLPTSGDVAGLLHQLDHNRIEEVLTNARMATVRFIMPEIDIAYSNEFSTTLKKLGVVKLFTPNPEIRIAKAAKLRADSIYHNTRIKVNWQGTEAAASTAIVFLESALLEERKMIVDKPFILMIIHEDTRAILFIGIIVDPGKGLAGV